MGSLCTASRLTATWERAPRSRRRSCRRPGPVGTHEHACAVRHDVPDMLEVCTPAKRFVQHPQGGEGMEVVGGKAGVLDVEQTDARETGKPLGQRVCMRPVQG